MSIPTRISMKQINELLEGFFYANALQIPITSREAAERTKVNPDVATRNMSFLCDAGFLIKEGASYRLTDIGLEYAQWLSWDKYDEASIRLSQILKQYDFAMKIVHYVRVAGPVPKNEVVDRVGVLAGVAKTSQHRRGAIAFVDLLTFSGLTEDDDGTIKIGRDKSIISTESISEENGTAKYRLPLETHTPISITLQISSETDPDKLRALIKVIKEEFLNVKVVESESATDTD
ncbi:MAG: hypothetical protein ACTSWA_12785 [Candidatus Thorarchaeota archaeon]